MKVYLLRHGETDYNAQQRYQGWLDLPLSEKGRVALIQADFSPEQVYVTSLLRTWQTADILFPGAKQIPVDGLREMNVGDFEGRNAQEMEQDPAYRAWADSDWEGDIPGGESRAAFFQRVWEAFVPLVDQALERGEERLVIVAHGGTQVALLSRCALPQRANHDWLVPNGGGFVLDASRWREARRLFVIEQVQYTRKEDANV
ncbi:MAG: histidine phosphatase family protein [Lawsonibacter sp.]|nr:histidine phosphatase family protein [Lawsonibacter sp.]